VADGEAAKALASKLGQERSREREDDRGGDEGSSDSTDLVPERKYQTSQTTQDNLRRVLGTIPENERAKLKFRFNVKKQNPKGGIYKNQAGEFVAYGEDWQTKIKTSIAQTKGPGDYEGVPFDHSNKQIDGAEPWNFEISEEQAREWGWAGPSDEEKRASEDAAKAPSLSTSGPPGRQGVIVPPPSAPAPPVDPVEAVKKEAEVTRAQIDLEKARQELDRTKKVIQAQQEDDPSPKKPEPSGPEAYETFSKQLLDSERARIRAEEEAKSTRAVADKESELLKQKGENDKEILKLKTEAAESKARADAALSELRADLARRESDFTRKLDEIKTAMNTSDRERDRAPKRPDYAEIAAAIGAALGPLASAFAPLATALQNKLMEPPPKPEKAPDPSAMISAMADVMEKFKPPAPPKQPEPVNPMEIVRQTVDLLRASQPAQLPAPAPAPAIDAMDIVKQTIGLLKTIQPQQPQVIQQPSVAPIDPQTYMNQVLSTAERLQATFGGGGRDDDDRPPPQDTLDLLVQSKEKLGRIGVPVQIGLQEVEKKSMVKDFADAAKEILPAFGKAVAESGYFNRPQAQPQPAPVPAPAPAPAKPQPDPAAEQHRRREIQKLAYNKEMQRRRALAAQQQRAQPPAQPQAPAPAPQMTPQMTPQPAPQPRPTPNPNRFAPPGSVAYGLPAAEALPGRLQARPGFVPTESLPQRPAPQPSFMPTEAIPTQTLTPQQSEFMRRKQAAEREALARRAAAQKAAADRVAAQKAAVAASQPQAAPPQAAPQPVLEAPPQPQSEPVAVPPPPAPPAARPAPAPTAKTWGEICDYLIKAIRKPEDPDAAALYLFENHRGAVDAIVSQSHGSVELVEVGLMALSSQVGPYGSTVSELASAIRVEPGKAWAANLLTAFKKAKEGK
jgi:hypothetical protein